MGCELYFGRKKWRCEGNYHAIVCAGFAAEGKRFFGDAFVDDAVGEHGLTDRILGLIDMEVGKVLTS